MYSNKISLFSFSSSKKQKKNLVWNGEIVFAWLANSVFLYEQITNRWLFIVLLIVYAQSCGSNLVVFRISSTYAYI